jgi:hypothetical protein
MNAPSADGDDDKARHVTISKRRAVSGWRGPANINFFIFKMEP